MNRNHFSIWLCALTALLLSSCVTQRQMTYLSDASAAKADSVNAHFVAKSEMIIRSGDALTISVSALDKEAVVPYNLPAVVYSAPGTNKVQTTPELQYFIVDEQGDVNFPVLGKLHLAGLKRTEAEQLIKSRLEQQVQNPMVLINHVDAAVSVLGEVAKPGRIPMTTGRMTILDALAAAGDLTTYGKRDNVLVTREVNGKMEMARVNLRTADLFNSPYFYLQQNDVVYVSPNKVRAISSTNAQLWLSVVSTVASAATVIVTVVSVSKK
jgi:polysaccharide export outer membrane protein